MASRALALPRTSPLDALLASIPSLPRPILARLTARMIDRLDELDGDPDLEPEEDCCDMGDDRGTSSERHRFCGDSGVAWRGDPEDEDRENDNPELRERHRDRIRRDLCDFDRWGRASLVRTYGEGRR